MPWKAGLGFSGSPPSCQQRALSVGWLPLCLLSPSQPLYICDFSFSLAHADQSFPLVASVTERWSHHVLTLANGRGLLCWVRSEAVLLDFVCLCSAERATLTSGPESLCVSNVCSQPGAEVLRLRPGFPLCLIQKDLWLSWCKCEKMPFVVGELECDMS